MKITIGTPKPEPKFLEGHVYYNPDLGNHYLAAFIHGVGCMFVNVGSGMLMSNPYATQAEAEARMRQDGMYEVEAELHILA